MKAPKLKALFINRGAQPVPAANCGSVPLRAGTPGGTPGELAGGDARATSHAGSGFRCAMLRSWRLLMFLFVVFWLVQPLAAQDANKSSASRHCLWKVQGTNATVYLLGSFHLLKADDWPLAAPLESAFTNSPIAVFETDMAKMEQGETQMKLLTKSQLPAGETLKDQLSAETYEKFLEYVKKLGLPEVMFNRFKPSMAAITLAMLEIQKLGFDPARGVDKHFFERARKDSKEIVGLETVDFQIGLVTEFSKEEGELVMKSTLGDIETMEKSFAELLQAWKTGDTSAIEKLMNESLREAPAIAKRLLTDRNRNWLPKIRELLRGDKNAVVIVGAGHLVGREGVVELLQKEGLKVTQL